MCTPTITLLDLTGRLRILDEIIIFKNDLRPVRDSISAIINLELRVFNTTISARANPIIFFFSSEPQKKVRVHYCHHQIPSSIRTNKFQKKKTGNQIRNLNIPPPPIQRVMWGEKSYSRKLQT
jgi:hypothetical protein